MLKKTTILSAAIGLVAFAAVSTSSSEASAQGIPAAAVRDKNWGLVSDVFLVAGAAVPTLMPRVYYSDPVSTVGWKGRWHFSQLAPAAVLVGATWFVDSPVKRAIGSLRPGCSTDETTVLSEGCESFGGPSTHAFASWASTGAGLGIFLVDTFKYSDGRFNAGSFIGNVAFPVVASVFTSIGRGVGPGAAQGYESGGQILAGGLTGFGVGALVGVAYAFFQRPSCGYGNAVVCW